MSLIEIALIAVIAIAVFFAVRRIIRMKKNGCSCGCSECNRACAASKRK